MTTADLVRRLGLAGVLCAFAAPATPAARYPSRPIRLIAPFPSGGMLDVVAHLVARKLADGMRTSVVVDNRPGANGVLGAERVARANPDGYTALFATGSFSSNVAVHRDLPYDAERDLAPVTQIARSYGLILVVHPEVPARSLKDMIALAKAGPGKLSLASSSAGSLTHLAGEYLKFATDINLIQATNKPSSRALNDVLGRRADMAFASAVLAQPLIRAARLHAIAITGSTRTPALPDIPTFKESGYPDFEITGWYGLWFTGGTPHAIVTRTCAEVIRFIGEPQTRARLSELGLVGVGSTPEEFARFIADDIALKKRIASRIGLRQR